MIAVTVLCAILDGQPYPPDGVPDTPAHRALWERMSADVDEMAAAGIIPDLPAGADLGR